jgi:hypothetical protein
VKKNKFVYYSIMSLIGPNKYQAGILILFFHFIVTPGLVQAQEDVPVILLLGWSSDGKAACLQRFTDSEMACYTERLIVVDAVSDLVLFNEIILELIPHSGMDLPLDEEQAKAEAQMTIKSTLEKYSIVLQESIEPEPFPLQKASVPSARYNQYMPSLDLQLVPCQLITETTNIPDVIREYTISVNTDDGYTKMIAQGKFCTEECVYDSIIEGYFKSPFENRILVVVLFYYLGTDYDTGYEYFLSGCHLNVGFFQMGE